VVAGMSLAVIVALGWVYWGKSIKRRVARQRSEAEAFHKTNFNTMRNATASKPRLETYTPLFSRPAEKKIRFAGDDGKVDRKVDNEWRPDQPSPTLVNHQEVATSHAPPGVVPNVSKPKLSRSVKGSQRFSPLALAAATKDRLSIASLRESASFGGGISHRQSTIDSASMYSTASGEERGVWTLSDPILAALNLGSLESVDPAFRSSSRGTDRNSPTSPSRTDYPAVDQEIPNRHSQASSGSGKRPAVDENGTFIGMAY